jgi:hypothetical protein
LQQANNIAVSNKPNITTKYFRYYNNKPDLQVTRQQARYYNSDKLQGNLQGNKPTILQQ